MRPASVSFSLGLGSSPITCLRTGSTKNKYSPQTKPRSPAQKQHLLSSPEPLPVVCRGLATRQSYGPRHQSVPSPSGFRSPLLFFPGILETAARRGGGLDHGCLFGSQGTRAGTHAQQNLTVLLYCQYFLSNLCLHWRWNDAANPGLLVGVAPPDSVRDGIQVHSSCWFFVLYCLCCLLQ